MKRHEHYPAPATRDDLDDIAVVEHTVPYRNGTHAICYLCRRPIVFIEGFELRRSYWRATR